MSNQLAQQIRELRHGEHACLIYDNHQTQMDTVLPFIQAGLERNESCLYIAGENSIEDMKGAFSAYGINVEREAARGALIFSQNNMQSGKFDPGAMVGVLQGLLDDAKKKGFSGFRAAGEMAWVLGTSCGCEDLIEYEALLNERFPTTLTGICQYNRSRFEPEVIRGILRTHPVIIVDDKICRNLYCESKDILEKHNANDLGVGWMINNLLRFHAIEENLRSMIQLRDDFLSVASHELNTPLTALKLRNEAQVKKVNVTEGQWRKFNELNLRSVYQLAGIVRGMLDVTRIGKGTLKLNLQDGVDLAEIVRGCLEHIPESFEIDLDLADGVTGRWDPVRLGQVVSNLLSNAIKYGESKPVRISIHGDAKLACVSVQDQGSGIAPQDMKRIFKLYERAVSFRNISGLGIGLFVSDQIVRAHGGELRVESELGKGSIFHVELPRE